MSRSRNFRVLHVEDDDDHHELFRLAIAAADESVQLARAVDGTSALSCLRHSSPFDDALPPDLVVLDLKIPGPDGHAVLEHLKSDARLRRIPVVVLSSSANERDVRRALEARANAYVTKPTSVSGFDEFAADLRGFWARWNIGDPERDVTLRN